jgi:hypothetical protein
MIPLLPFQQAVPATTLSSSIEQITTFWQGDGCFSRPCNTVKATGAAAKYCSMTACTCTTHTGNTGLRRIHHIHFHLGAHHKHGQTLGNGLADIRETIR